MRAGACSYGRRKGPPPRVSSMRLPQSLLDWVRVHGRYPHSQPLEQIAEAFFALRNQITHRGGYGGTTDRWQRLTPEKVSTFDWHVVAALVAEAGYQPYIDTFPLPAVIPTNYRKAAAQILSRLREDPSSEAAYQELASRTVVAGAAAGVGETLRDIAIAAAKDEVTREEVHRELAMLFPTICAVWSLGQDVLRAEREGGNVEWRPILFQGLT